MKVDYLSDLHIDFLIKSSKTISEGRVRAVFDSILRKKDSDYLIIAGDTSEYMGMTFRVFQMIKKIYGYKKIYFVFGNHDMWLNNPHQGEKYFWDSYNKMNYMKHLLKEDEDLILLDGGTYEIGYYTIGGAMGMSDLRYEQEYQKYSGMYSTYVDIWDYWKETMNDSKLFYPRKPNLNHFVDIEHQKIIKTLSDYPDIMVTHYCPIISDTVTSEQYKGERSNTFYMMDFEDYIYEYKPKFWVHGHLHSNLDMVVGDTRLLRNPIGYPSEKLKRSVKTFEIF